MNREPSSQRAASDHPLSRTKSAAKHPAGHCPDRRRRPL